MTSEIIGEAFVAIRPQVDGAGFQRDTEKAVAGPLSRIKGQIGAALKTPAGSVAGIVAGGVAIKKVSGFLRESVADARASELAQLGLVDAFAKFPQLAGASVAELQSYNTTLAAKTKYDDDAIASGQAVLAQFGLTAEQIRELTPTLLDYASKTGKDVPAAAKALGMATQGQTRALKGVGIQLDLTAYSAKGAAKAQEAVAKAQERAGKSAQAVSGARQKLIDLQTVQSGKDKLGASDAIALRKAREAVAAAEGKHSEAVFKVQQAMAKAKPEGDAFGKVADALRDKLGGFAEKEGKTSAGRAEILANQMGELRESVGTALLPTLNSLTGTLTTVVGWFANMDARGQAVVKMVLLGAGVIFTIVKVTQAWTAVQAALNVVMSANPIGLVVLAIAAFVAGAVLAYRKSETFRDVVNGAFRGVSRVVGNVVAFMIRGFRGMLTVWLTVADGIVSGAAKALGWVPGIGDKLKAADEAFDNFKNETLATLDAMAEAADGVGEKTGRKLKEGFARVVGPNGLVTTVITVTPNGRVFEQGSARPGRRERGPVVAGRTYLVGELGPELFTPTVHGRVAAAGGDGASMPLHPDTVAQLVAGFAAAVSVLADRPVVATVDGEAIDRRLGGAADTRGRVRQ